MIGVDAPVSRAGLQQRVARQASIHIGENVIVAQNVDLARIVAQFCRAAEISDGPGGNVVMPGADSGAARK